MTRDAMALPNQIVMSNIKDNANDLDRLTVEARRNI